jgi:hypothetical protein
MPIPMTRTRLKGYITLRTQAGGINLADVAVPLPPLNQLIIIGAAQQLTINQPRDTNNFRREFDPQQEGKPAETYPGLPHYTVTLHRVDLYDKNMIESFGFKGVNIVKQFKPIILVVEQPVPVDDAGNPLSVNGDEFKQRSYIIPGCWFNDMPIGWDIADADQKYVVEVEMVVRDIISPE